MNYWYIIRIVHDNSITNMRTIAVYVNYSCVILLVYIYFNKFYYLQRINILYFVDPRTR